MGSATYGQPLQEQEEAEDEDTEVTKDPSWSRIGWKRRSQGGLAGILNQTFPFCWFGAQCCWIGIGMGDGSFFGWALKKAVGIG